jgi:hypothetical protein
VVAILMSLTSFPKFPAAMFSARIVSNFSKTCLPAHQNARSAKQKSANSSRPRSPSIQNWNLFETYHPWHFQRPQPQSFCESRIRCQFGLDSSLVVDRHTRD